MYATELRKRMLVDGVVVEWGTAFVRRRDLKRLLRDHPRFATWHQEYEPHIGFVVLSESPLHDGQLILNPRFAAKARRDQAEWEALLDQEIEVVSEEGAG